MRILLNTNPEDEVKDKHQIFDTAQTPTRHRHPAKERQNSRALTYKGDLLCLFSYLIFSHSSNYEVKM